MIRTIQRVLDGLKALFKPGTDSPRVGSGIASGNGTCRPAHATIADLGSQRPRNPDRDPEIPAQEIFERVPVGLYRSTEDGRILDANPAFAGLLGYENPSELRGVSVETLYANVRDRRRWQDAIEQSEVLRNFKVQLRRKDTEQIWVLNSARRLTDPVTGAVFYEGSAVDVTAHHEAEAQVQKLSAALTHSPDLVMITDPYGRIEYVNPAYEKASGYSLEEVVGETPRIFNGGEDGLFSEKLWEAVTPERAFQGRSVNHRRDGSTYHVLQTISAIQDDQGRTECFVSIGKEITSQVELEQQAQRLEAVGQLAAGIAHDFNNLLTVIQGGLQLAQDGLPSWMREASDDLATAMRAAEKGAALTQQLLAFGRRQPHSPRSVDLVAATTEFMEMAVRVLPNSVTVDFSTSVDEAWVRIDPSQLDQILLNLSVNACDAMPEGGTLSIKIGRRPSQRSPKGLSAASGTQAHIFLEIADTGVGMDQRTLERVFEPFFTTKEIGRGTGLGLATVYGLVTQNDGKIDLRSMLGEGTSFEISFPEADPGDED